MAKGTVHLSLQQKNPDLSGHHLLLVFLEFPYIPPICGHFQTIFSQSVPRLSTKLMLNFELSFGILIEEQGLAYALNVATAPQLSDNCHDVPVSLEEIIHCIKCFNERNSSKTHPLQL